MLSCSCSADCYARRSIRPYELTVQLYCTTSTGIPISTVLVLYLLRVPTSMYTVELHVRTVLSIYVRTCMLIPVHTGTVRTSIYVRWRYSYCTSTLTHIISVHYVVPVLVSSRLSRQVWRSGGIGNRHNTFLLSAVLMCCDSLSTQQSVILGIISLTVLVLYS